jgi:hypothetical protein
MQSYMACMHSSLAIFAWGLQGVWWEVQGQRLCRSVDVWMCIHSLQLHMSRGVSAGTPFCLRFYVVLWWTVQQQDL